MKLIVGLGNPGKEYVNTRHNIGFSYLDYVAKDRNLSFEIIKFNAFYLDFYINNEKVIFIKPLSYMNLSGEVVKKYVDYYNISLNDVLVIHDDLDMCLGRTKVVFNSSCGGHNGIRDIERKLGSKKYNRLKIGIAKDNNVDIKDYVLGKFNNLELLKINETFIFLKDFIEDFCNYDLNYIMNKYNRK